LTASSNRRIGVTREELIDIIQKHEVYLDGRGGGVRANLGPAEISNPDGTSANREWPTNLENAALEAADLTAANLKNARLAGSNSARARLTGATLTGTELQGKITIRGRRR
jgi:uncharacterized protein YjbI with pentapeptide repeats